MEINDGVLLRKKRMTQIEKNTCQLFIQTDHLFYKYYKTREAVIAQVRHTSTAVGRQTQSTFESLTTIVCPAQISNHVKAIDAIYQGTDFMGIRNISFMVKRIRVRYPGRQTDKTFLKSKY